MTAAFRPPTAPRRGRIYTTAPESFGPAIRGEQRADEAAKGQSITVDDYGQVSDRLRRDLRVAEVANPRPGDRIEIDGEAFLIQGEPVRDRERLVWTVDLRPA